ncbi:MAG TPA: hypothetical protein DCS93_10940 [Microscillaceae bacterium]|nr:hypothetical protein [Microscillaceae bacterium]
MKYLFFALLSLIIFTPNIAQAQNNTEVKKEFETVKVLLEDILITVEHQRDSLIKLLNNSLYRERRFRKELVRLNKGLKHSKYRFDSLQNAIVNRHGTSNPAEYRRQIEQMTIERNKLAGQNQQLMQKLAKLNKDNRALFALKISVTPGQMYESRFRPTVRARKTNRIQVKFTLNRTPSPNEEITIKLFNSINQEIPLVYKGKLGKLTSINQQLIIEPAPYYVNSNQNLSRGLYSICFFLTNVTQNIKKQPIGITTFALR